MLSLLKSILEIASFFTVIDMLLVMSIKSQPSRYTLDVYYMSIMFYVADDELQQFFGQQKQNHRMIKISISEGECDTDLFDSFRFIRHLI